MGEDGPIADPPCPHVGKGEPICRLCWLEVQVEDIWERLEEMDRLVACDDCGVVFKDRSAYGEHPCAGKQGR